MNAPIEDRHRQLARRVSAIVCGVAAPGNIERAAQAIADDESRTLTSPRATLAVCRMAAGWSAKNDSVRSGES